MSETLYGTEFFAGRSETVTRSASVVVPVLCELLKPTSVVDFGCGQGEWLEAFGLEDMLGVDIAEPPANLTFSHIRHDLSLPFGDAGAYDLAICLEVGEHLPESAADVLIETITRHASDVVFSAAVPGQEGKGHINCQPHSYWEEKFYNRGYTQADVIRPRIRDDERVSPWYRHNIFLYG